MLTKIDQTSRLMLARPTANVYSILCSCVCSLQHWVEGGTHVPRHHVDDALPKSLLTPAAEILLPTDADEPSRNDLLNKWHMQFRIIPNSGWAHLFLPELYSLYACSTGSRSWLLLPSVVASHLFNHFHNNDSHIRV